MTKVIAMANHKGGVGKTTSTVNIGTILTLRGKRVLLVDLDAQANLTASLLVEQPERTIYDAIKERKNIPVIPIRENLDIVPSCLDLAGIELEIGGTFSRETILKELLEPLKGKYDYILLDCAPSLGLLTVNAFTAANSVIIPLTAEALPVAGIEKIQDFMKLVQDKLNPGLFLEGIIITRYMKKNLSSLIEDNLRGVFGEKVYKTRIRENVSVAEAPLKKTDITTYAPSSNGAEDYKNLVNEILSLQGDKE